MSIKNKIIMFVIVALVIITVISPNEMISAFSATGLVWLILIMKISDLTIRRNLIKKIETENLDFIKVKENNKLQILLIIVIMFNIYIMMKSRYDLFVSQSSGNSINLISYIDSLNASEKLVAVACLALTILVIFVTVQSFISKCIVSKDKIIFYDGQIFDIKDIEYLKSPSKKYKKIKLGKGFTDRKIIINIEDFEKVKTLLENKKVM